MTEWWSYRPSDFLMFSSRVYFKQIESFNVSLWPLHLLMLLVGAGVVGLVIRGRPDDRRAVALILAMLWFFVGWAYLWSYLSIINWAATYAAYGFLAQSILTIVVYVMPPKNRKGSTTGLPGVAVMAAAILLYPSLSLVAGRGVASSEVFGIMPDPTAIATIGFLAATRQRYDAILFIGPALWCGISSATLYTMNDAAWWPPVGMCILGVVAAIARRRPQIRRTSDKGEQ
ncbi:hypothetical protein SAMN05216228_106620 [Rhizobium tibeticum]|uniref:MFS transporter permease n=1 Tax=Rhizobium tibeticum TaxID=501024 RepID=A0A1H8WJB3_9HYPH|nr:DUF6064 family protein [Rhizobium tibeticum]SEI20722.1 hypothetical protein RTCCBAU85039_6458 [Rhizobium tibeticum]SEP27721.1 hypothetical protein SAMN05216228_106620 [Rhizobium tibeticum]